VHRLAYNSDVAAGQLAVFQGASEAPISELIRVERATRKNSQPAAAQRVAFKMSRRSGLGRTVRAGLAVRGRISKAIRACADFGTDDPE
jgi:hypothetical protein